MENWQETKSRIKAKFGKISDWEIESLKNDLSQLSERIQNIYGISKSEADLQCAEFVKPESVIMKPKNVEKPTIKDSHI